MKRWHFIMALFTVGLLGMANFSHAEELPSNEQILQKAKLLEMDPDLLEAIYQQNAKKNTEVPNHTTINQLQQVDHTIYVSYKGNVYWVIVRSNPFSLMSRMPREGEVLAWEKQSIQAYLLPNADPATFIELGAEYAKDKQQVYNRDKVIANADPLTFQVMNAFYVKDAHFVYFRPITSDNDLDKFANQPDAAEMMVIRQADPVTFNVLDQGAVSLPNFYYAKDRQHVYYAGEIMQDATPSTFSIFTEHPTYSTDNQTVYLYGKPCTDIDANSFEAMSDSFTRDKNNVYMLCHAIKALDANSFELVSKNGFSPALLKDKNGVYWVETTYMNQEVDLIDWKKKKLPGADPKTFQLLVNSYKHSGPYGRDRQHVYYYTKPILGADSKTFEMLRDDNYGVDKRKIYKFGEPLSLEDFRNDLYQLQDDLMADGLYPIAINYLSRLLSRKNDDDGDLYYSFRADMYAAQGEHKKAIHDYESAINLLKKIPYQEDRIFELYLKIIPICISLKEYDLARSNIRKAETFINEDSRCSNNNLNQLNELKADIHAARGKTDEAIKIYQTIKNNIETCYQGTTNEGLLIWIETINRKLEKRE